MSHCIKENTDPDRTKNYAATVRMDEADKTGLKKMTDEHPLYTESVVIRAAVQMFMVMGPELRTRIILASLNGSNIRNLLLREGRLIKDELS